MGISTTSSSAVSTTNYTANNATTANNNTDKYTSLAKDAGLNINDYYTYDSDGNVTGVDMVKLNADLKASRASDEEKEADVDSFHKSEIIKNAQKNSELKSQAEDKKDSIDSEYEKAFEKYASFLKNTQDTEVQKTWDSIKLEEQKLTSVTASSTTVLEGAKEFILSLTKASDAAEQSARSQHSEKTEKDDSSYEIKEVSETENYDSSFFNNPFFKSSYDTSYSGMNEFALDA